LAVAGPAVDGLEEVARLLSDGKFMTAVVHRKQRALLGTATTLLLSLTDRRYAFADNFRILDSDSGQPRDVKTLSGGETFLASLALALALVELASRTGARVEALFLDEGFGSLDRTVLTEALETLGRQTIGGRLVVLISHMRAITENIEHVLVVEKTLTGSQAHWASADERDQIITDDLAAGLLP
jgi:exonuclease SbcC